MIRRIVVRVVAVLAVVAAYVALMLGVLEATSPDDTLPAPVVVGEVQRTVTA